MSRRISASQTDLIDSGQLMVNVLSRQNNYPVPDATVSISYTGEPDNVLEQLVTNSSGQTETLDVSAPPLEYSQNPSEEQPYAEYTVRIQADGFEPYEVSGAEVFSGQLAIQGALLRPAEAIEPPSQAVVIPPHTLYGDYPPKIAEPEIKPVTETGEIVLSRVVVPETVVVHDGPPSDTSAQNYYVSYREYIKNVASSEIYSTWPESTIRANVLAIMSFTLNRVYTEWYRNQSRDFTITSSTAFDHKWIYGRNIFENISLIVDEIFNNYLSRPEVKQPILTQYCDGRQVQCPNWMTLL